MLKVFICEDNIEQQNKLEKYINDYIIIEDLDMEIEVATDNPNTVLDRVIDMDGSGIYFLDIDLKSDISGIELAEKIREYDPRGFIVFITSHAEMTYLTFMYRIEAMDFIIKRNWSEMQNRISACLSESIIRYNSKKNNQQQVLSINLGDRVLSFEHNNILYIETSASVHKLILHAENRQVEFYGKMKDIEINLSSDFVRVHKSYLVNKNKISKVDKVEKVIHFTNGQSCLASVRLIKNLWK